MKRALMAVLAAGWLAGCHDSGLRNVDVQPMTASELTAANQKVQRLEQEKADLAGQIRQAQATAAELDRKLKQQEAAADSAATELEVLKAEVARQKDLLGRLDQDKLSAQAAEAEAKLKTAEEQTRKWEIDKAQLQKDLVRHEQELAVLREEIAKRDARLEQLAAKPPAARPKPPAATPKPPAAASKPSAETPKPPPPGTTISGEIIQSRADMARASVGSAVGVVRGAKLPIYRGQALIGYLHVSEVSPKESAGFVVDRRQEVKVVDRVLVQVK